MFQAEIYRISPRQHAWVPTIFPPHVDQFTSRTFLSATSLCAYKSRGSLTKFLSEYSLFFVNLNLCTSLFIFCERISSDLDMNQLPSEDKGEMAMPKWLAEVYEGQVLRAIKEKKSEETKKSEDARKTSLKRFDTITYSYPLFI